METRGAESLVGSDIAESQGVLVSAAVGKPALVLCGRISLYVRGLIHFLSLIDNCPEFQSNLGCYQHSRKEDSSVTMSIGTDVSLSSSSEDQGSKLI